MMKYLSCIELRLTVTVALSTRKGQEKPKCRLLPVVVDFCHLRLIDLCFFNLLLIMLYAYMQTFVYWHWKLNFIVV